MLSLFWVLVVVAQPTVNANRAMTLIMLNEVRICFIFIGSFQVCGCLRDDFISKREFVHGTFAVFVGSAYRTLVPYVGWRSGLRILSFFLELDDSQV